MIDKNNEVVFLIGNGFNFFLKEYIDNESATILKKKMPADFGEDWINILQKGLNKYCHLLDFLELDNYSYNGETLLYKLNDFIKSIENNDNSNEFRNYFNDNLQKLIANRIDSIFLETAIVNDLKNNKTLINVTARRLMKYDPKNSFAKKIQELVRIVSNNNYYIYTTNYDFITGSVFTEDHYEKNERKILHVYNFDTKLKLEKNYIQIHGNYQFSNKNSNNIICSSPKEKEKQIDVSIFNVFKDRIENSKVLILFGMGLTSDPHILDEINKKKDIDIIIIGTNRKRYYENHYPGSKNKHRINFTFLKQNRIYFLDTTETKEEDYFVSPIETKEEDYFVSPMTPEKLINNLNKIFISIKEEKRK